MTCKKDKGVNKSLKTKEKESEIRRITKIKHREPLLERRVEHVSEMLQSEEVLLAEYERAAVTSGDNNSEYSEYLEQLGTYLIDSPDKKSCRELDYSYYQNDRRYGQYAIGRNTFPINFSEDNSVIDSNYLEDEYGMGFDDMFIDINSMSDNQIRRMIRIGVSERQVEGSKLKLFFEELHSHIIDNISHDNDAQIYNAMIENNNDREISEKLSIPRSTVAYRVNRIIDVIKGFDYEYLR